MSLRAIVGKAAWLANQENAGHVAIPVEVRGPQSCSFLVSQAPLQPREPPMVHWGGEWTGFFLPFCSPWEGYSGAEVLVQCAAGVSEWAGTSMARGSRDSA